MKHEQGTQVEDFEAGRVVEADLWLTSSSLREAKNGKPYWDGVFQDATGSVNARAWEDTPGRVEKLAALLEPGNPFRVQGKVDSFKDKIQIILSSARRLSEDEVDPSLFSPRTERPVREMVEEFDAALDSITDPDLKKLLQGFRQDELHFRRFCKAPAAKAIHHARVGGLLEHTLSLFRLARTVAPLYPSINLDLLAANCVFHDAGKMEEISTLPGFDYTVDGKLLGHIYMGARLAEAGMDAIPDFPAETRRQLIHLILSHQGDRDQGFGSPVDPLSPEAVLFHHLDNLDAKLQNCFDVMNRTKDSPEKSPFTDPRDNFPIRKGYYRVRLGSEGEDPDAVDKPEEGRDEGGEDPQPKLW